jgi:hypothetical protein
MILFSFQQIMLNFIKIRFTNLILKFQQNLVDKSNPIANYAQLFGLTIYRYAIFACNFEKMLQRN